MAKQKRSEQTRKKIIEAGARLFSEDGYHATSSKKIARLAGISIGSFYNHFKDKKDLLITVFEDHSTRVHEMIFESLDQDVFTSGDMEGKELVRSIISQAMKLHTLSPEFHRQMTVMRYSDAEIGSMMAEKDEQVVRMMMGLLSRNSEPLRVEDLEAAVRVVVHSVEEVVHSIKIFDSPVGEARMMDALADMIHRFLYR